MKQVSSCLRCSQPLAVASDTGLCRDCQTVVDAARYRSAAVASAISLGPPVDDLKSGIAKPDAVTVGDTISSSPAADALAAETWTHDSNASQPGLPVAPKGYTILGRLGGGGMGDVFLARELTAERTLAMKFLRAGSNAAAVDRFLVEVRALAALDHPNIVRVLSTDFNRPDPYFTMEYASGGTFSTIVDKCGPLDPTEAARLMVKVARAVDAAHRAGVIHRDLKPSNILIGGDGSPKVSDFGLAKRLDRDDGVTIHPGALGTPGYMPPEQVSNRSGEVGPAADVYGLGATLYHLLTGRPPHTGDSRDEIMSRVLSQPPERPRAIRPTLTMDLEAIVLKAMEKDSKRRYESATAFADDLDRFLAGQEVLAPQLTVSRRFRQWTSHNRNRLAGLGVALVLSIGLLIVGAILGNRDTQPKPDPGSQPQAPSPAEEIQKSLAADQPVDLLRSDGQPKHFVAHLAPAMPGGSEVDQSCLFQAFGYGMLEVVPNPTIDRYRVRMMVRHVDSRTGEKITPGEHNFIGFYFGHSGGVLPSGVKVHVLFGVTFSELDTSSNGNKAKPPEQFAFLRKMTFVEKPGHDVSLVPKKIASTNFKPALTTPGPWRPLEIEVSPDEVRIQWLADDGKMVDLVRWSGDDVRARYNQMRTDADKVHPGAADALPEWSPRLPLGLLSFKSAIAVKDLVIEPLPTR